MESREEPAGPSFCDKSEPPIHSHDQGRARAHFDGGAPTRDRIGGDGENVGAAKEVGKRAVESQHHVALAQVNMPVLADAQIEPEVTGQLSGAETAGSLRCADELAAMIGQVTGLPLEVAAESRGPPSLSAAECQTQR